MKPRYPLLAAAAMLAMPAPGVLTKAVADLDRPRPRIKAKYLQQKRGRQLKKNLLKGVRP